MQIYNLPEEAFEVTIVDVSLKVLIPSTGENDDTLTGIWYSVSDSFNDIVPDSNPITTKKWTNYV